MIKVYFPHGCYGTYLSQCIYSYTNLNTAPVKKFQFGFGGSSHDFWSRKKELHPIITYGHFNSPECEVDADYVVVIHSNSNHLLDYYNNHLFKAQFANLINWIREQLSDEESQHKLNTQWQYHGKLDENVPTWIMREWCSFWLTDVLKVNYNPSNYLNLNPTIELDTQDIFNNFTNIFKHIVAKLNLTICVDMQTIQHQHCEFLALQKFHQSQVRCHQYLYNLLSGQDGQIVVNTIFDEAYLQHLLRQNNLEIQCEGLNEFPLTIKQLRSITYETSNNNYSR